MNSLYDISWKVSEEEYRSDPSYSQSVISRFNREGFNHIDTLYDKVESPSLTFGSLVDTLVTGTSEDVDRKFMIIDTLEASGTIMKVVKDIFREFGSTHNSLESIPDSEIIYRAASFNYQNNWKPETRVKTIKEKGSEYYRILHSLNDRLLIDRNDYNDAVLCANTLRDHTYTKWYFEQDNPFDKSVERFYQLKFKGEWNKIPLKCMVDLIIADHKNKVIIPCDLKTTGKREWEFVKSFMEYNYWIQAQLYWYLIKENLIKDPVYKDYVLSDFRFIVINRYNRKPLIWKYSDTSSSVDCYYGKNNQYECKNWRQLVTTLHYYLSAKPEYPLNIGKINEIEKWLNYE